MWLEHPLRDNVNWASEQALQLKVEGCQIHQVGARFKVDQQVDVALVVVAATHQAPEDSDISSPMLTGKPEDLVAMLGKQPAESGAGTEPSGSVIPDQPRHLGLAPANCRCDLLLRQALLGCTPNCDTQRLTSLGAKPIGLRRCCG